MSTFNRLLNLIVLVVVIGGVGSVGGNLGRLVLANQVTTCAESIEACQ